MEGPVVDNNDTDDGNPFPHSSPELQSLSAKNKRSPYFKDFMSMRSMSKLFIRRGSVESPVESVALNSLVPLSATSEGLVESNTRKPKKYKNSWDLRECKASSSGESQSDSTYIVGPSVTSAGPAALDPNTTCMTCSRNGCSGKISISPTDNNLWITITTGYKVQKQSLKKFKKVSIPH